MARYRLVGSFHQVAQTGETYEKGDIVESEHNLKRAFPGKFKKLSAEEDSSSKPKKLAVEEAAPKARKAKGAKSRSVEPDKDNESKSKSKKKTKKKSKTPSIRDRLKKKTNLGKDVTAGFPAALQRSLRVLRTDDSKYNVVHEDDPFNALNEKPMNKVRTTLFCERYAPEISDD